MVFETWKAVCYVLDWILGGTVVETSHAILRAYNLKCMIFLNWLEDAKQIKQARGGIRNLM